MVHSHENKKGVWQKLYLSLSSKQKLHQKNVNHQNRNSQTLRPGVSSETTNNEQSSNAHLNDVIVEQDARKTEKRSNLETDVLNTPTASGWLTKPISTEIQNLNNQLLPLPSPENQASQQASADGLGDFFVQQFGYNGGVMQCPGSSVQLIIPRGAVPMGETYTIHAKIHTDYPKFHDIINLDDSSYIFAAIPEFLVDRKFEREVEIVIPHGLGSLITAENIRVLYGDRKNKIAFQEAKSRDKSTCNNVRLQEDVFFHVKDTSVHVFTHHFTQFTCVCGQALPLDLHARLYGSSFQLEDGTTEFRLRLYFLNQIMGEEEKKRVSILTHHIICIVALFA